MKAEHVFVNALKKEKRLLLRQIMYLERLVVGDLYLSKKTKKKLKLLKLP